MNLWIDLNQEEALALSQFFKRVGFSDFRSLAESNEEAYDMQIATTKIAKALAEHGYNPR